MQQYLAINVLTYWREKKLNDTFQKLRKGAEHIVVSLPEHKKIKYAQIRIQQIYFRQPRWSLDIHLHTLVALLHSKPS